MKTKVIIGCLVLILFAGCSSKFIVKSELPVNVAPQGSNSVLFLADPQIHSVYGLGLKQTTDAANVFSKVAIRPPELNILAPLVLQELIRKGQKNDDNKNPLLVVLGDATNIACSGEFDLFEKSIDDASKSGTVTLLAHGNHDTYLMGTLNSYIPPGSAIKVRESGVFNSDVPVDEHWWGKHTTPHLDDAKNWKGVCFTPKVISDDHGWSVNSPMNKSRWLAKYLNLLEKNGLDNTNKSKLKGKLEYYAVPDSPLGKLDFEVRGYLVAPEFNDDFKTSKLQEVSNSFIIQTAKIDTNHNILLIDTSVCGNARGGFKFASTNAGTNGCAGKAQIKLIKDYVSGLLDDDYLIVGSHFPLYELKAKERKELISIFNEHGSWSYMSGHTHSPLIGYEWGNETGVEVNIGSTTDWPMELHRVYFEDDSSNVQSIQSFYNSNQLQMTYEATSLSTSSELCRHLPSARELANLKVTPYAKKWVSPVGVINDCQLISDTDWDVKGKLLNTYINTITQRFSKEPEYREMVLQIAAAASKYEDGQRDLAGYIP